MNTLMPIGMPGTGVIKCKFREFTVLNQCQILIHRAFNGTIYLDPGRLKLAKGTATDAAHDNSIHRAAAKGVHGLTLSMNVMKV